MLPVGITVRFCGKLAYEKDRELYKYINLYDRRPLGIFYSKETGSRVCIYTLWKAWEEKVTQLFLENNALTEIHNFLQYQQRNIPKTVHITYLLYWHRQTFMSFPLDSTYYGFCSASVMA